MSTREQSVNHQGQGQLFTDGICEITIRVGLVAESDHVQMQWEVHDPRDGTLLNLQSWPDFHSMDLAARLRVVSDLTLMMAARFCEPFESL